MADHRSVFIVMGVSGCGKSTVGKLLAQELGLPFFDGDDYHPPKNIEKMASGKPLNDDDRQGWLERLNDLICNSVQDGLVLACSALKESYRQTITNEIEKELIWVYLEGSFEEIHARLKGRKVHFMPSALLKSQFDTLEVPDYALSVPIRKSPEQIVNEVLERIK